MYIRGMNKLKELRIEIVGLRNQKNDHLRRIIEIDSEIDFKYLKISQIQKDLK